jgi:hypothetical protein
MIFIHPHQVPAGRKVTYANFVCTMQPGKAEPYRIRMTVGGDRLDAYQDVRSPAIGLVDTKLHLNSVISDAHLGARYCTGDLKDFFLMSDMPIFQYMRIHRCYLTAEVLAKYNLTDAHFDSKGYIYVKIRKGMYGLKDAAILASRAHPDSGATPTVAPRSLSRLMTSASNSSLNLMLIISSPRLLPSMPSPRTGLAPVTSDSRSIRTTPPDTSTSPCQATYPKHFSVKYFRIQYPVDHYPVDSTVAAELSFLVLCA